MIKDYKGYSAKVYVDEEQGILHGEVLGIADVVTFQGKDVEELVKAFHDSVDDYLAYCKERGEEAEKPYSGRFVLRMSPTLHRKVAMEAKKNDVSMNDWIIAAIEDFFEEVAAGTEAARRLKCTTPEMLEMIAADELRRVIMSSYSTAWSGSGSWLSCSLSEAIRERLSKGPASTKDFMSRLGELLSETCFEKPSSERRTK